MVTAPWDLELRHAAAEERDVTRTIHVVHAILNKGTMGWWPTELGNEYRLHLMGERNVLSVRIHWNVAMK